MPTPHLTAQSLSIQTPDGQPILSLPLTLSSAEKTWAVERLEAVPGGWIGHTADAAVTLLITKDGAGSGDTNNGGANNGGAGSGGAINGGEPTHLSFEWRGVRQPGDLTYFAHAPLDPAHASHAHAFIPDTQYGVFPVSGTRAFTVTAQAEAVKTLGIPARDIRDELWMTSPPPHVFALGDERGAGVAFSIPEPIPTDATQFVLHEGGTFSLLFRHHNMAVAPEAGGGRLPRVFVDWNVADRHDTLARHLAHAKELGLLKSPDGSYAEPETKPQPAWWHNPLYCTWGDQCRLAEEGVPTNQSLTRERILAWADKIRTFYKGEVNFIIDDGYFVGMGDYRLRPELYPTVADFQALIAELKARNFRVILWYTPFWVAPGSPVVTEHPEWLLHGPDGSLLSESRCWGHKYRYDWSHPEVSGRHREIIRFLLAELGADGIKVDMTYTNPVAGDVKRHDPAWGSGDAIFNRVLRLVHGHVQAAKPGAFMTISSIEPAFAPYAGAVRLNDLFDHSSCRPWYRRAELVTRLMPGVAIDVDGWPSNGENLREYPFVATTFGAPVTYYIDGTEVGCEEIADENGVMKKRLPAPFGEAEINRIAAVWNTYDVARVEGGDVINVDAEADVFERREGGESGEGGEGASAKGRLKALSLNRSALVAYGAAEIRVASNKTQTLEIPLEDRAEPTRVERVGRDGSRKEVPFKVEPARENASGKAGKRVVLEVEDAANGVLYYSLS